MTLLESFFKRTSHFYELYQKNNNSYGFAKCLYNINKQIYADLMSQWDSSSCEKKEIILLFLIHYESWFASFEILEQNLLVNKIDLKFNTEFVFNREAGEIPFPKDKIELLY